MVPVYVEPYCFWFKDYLTNRCQYVKIEDIESEQLKICGVPQGSTLGPLLTSMTCQIVPVSFPLEYLIMILIYFILIHLQMK